MWPKSFTHLINCFNLNMASARRQRARQASRYFWGGHGGRKYPWRYLAEVWGLSCGGGAGGEEGARSPWGLWDFTAGGGEVRAEEAAWRSKEQGKRQQVNLSALKNISRRAWAGWGRSLSALTSIFSQDTELLWVCGSAPVVLRTLVTSNH